MADKASNIPRPFDVRTVRLLVGLMSAHDLSEIDLREGEQRIRLLRGPNGMTVTELPQAAVAALSTPTAVVPAAAPVADKPPKTYHEIKSPTPGTFYVAPNPGAEPFVRVGSRVTPTTTVCVIEAMKIFSEIPAECAGVIADILVDNQQPVEYGQVLFRVDPTG